MINLSLVNARRKLIERREPYWQKIAKGQYIGFRVTKFGKGNWIARYRSPHDYKQHFHPLGDYFTEPETKMFEAACKDAREWFSHMTGGGAIHPKTVLEACKEYAETRPEAVGRFERYVYEEPIAHIPLNNLNQVHVKTWRKHMEAKLTARGNKRSNQTINRDMVPFKAALNEAYQNNECLSDAAWKHTLKPYAHNGDGKKQLALTKSERIKLLDNTSAESQAFFKMLCLLPLRPGAAAQLCVKDFNPNTNVLHIRQDKKHTRDILVPQETAKFIVEQIGVKSQEAFIFQRTNGEQFNKDFWKVPIKEAAERAKLSRAITVYSLRHSVITDLVISGLDLLTVAQISGTGVTMIERHYGHHRMQHAADALKTLHL